MTKTLVKDPVCAMDVETSASAVHSEHEGHMYYFCGAGCKSKFDHAPEQYLGKAGDAAKGGKSACGCCS